jgi:hypothetical protein
MVIEHRRNDNWPDESEALGEEPVPMSLFTINPKCITFGLSLALSGEEPATNHLNYVTADSKIYQSGGKFVNFTHNGGSPSNVSNELAKRNVIRELAETFGLVRALVSAAEHS